MSKETEVLVDRIVAGRVGKNSKETIKKSDAKHGRQVPANPAGSNRLALSQLRDANRRRENDAVESVNFIPSNGMPEALPLNWPQIDKEVVIDVPKASRREGRSNKAQLRPLLEIP
jgi:hypothetical protein